MNITYSQECLAAVKKSLEILSSENMPGQLDALYGKSYEEAASLTPGSSKMAKAGFEKKTDKKTGRDIYVNRLGWGPENIKWMLGKGKPIFGSVLKDADDIRKKFKNVVFCGMGGSGLSVELVNKIFSADTSIKLYSLRTTDPRAIENILSTITKNRRMPVKKALTETLIICVSKSGTTKETLTHKEYFEQLYAKYEVDTSKHLWVITDQGSPMDNGQYIQREIQLNGKDDIGGRFTSPTTRVFLLPLALLAPKQFVQILTKALEIDTAVKIEENIGLQLGAILYNQAALFKKDKITLIMPEILKFLPAWAEQLVEESLGKHGKGITLFYGENLLKDCLKKPDIDDRVYVRVVLGNDSPENELWNYITAKKYSWTEISMDNIEELGALMLALEKAVSAIGYLWDICFVDQPAVEGYKEATRQVMAQCEKSKAGISLPKDWNCVSNHGLTLFYEPIMKIGLISKNDLLNNISLNNLTPQSPASVLAVLLMFLKEKSNFEAAEIAAYGCISQKFRSMLEMVRSDIFTEQLHIPCKIGEGPDKNHSYHQNIEDGKDMFLSIYIMPKKYGQPAELAYDENLIKAQTIGTVNSLINNKRKVLLITVESDLDSSIEQLHVFFAKTLECLMLI